jgi:hypothetical protein
MGPSNATILLLLFRYYCHNMYCIVVVGLERGPPSAVITIEEVLERKSSGSSLEIREYIRRDISG